MPGLVMKHLHTLFIYQLLGYMAVLGKKTLLIPLIMHYITNNFFRLDCVKCT